MFAHDEERFAWIRQNLYVPVVSDILDTLGRRAQEYGFRLGLALVLTLMVFATWNDIVHLGWIKFLKGLVS